MAEVHLPQIDDDEPPDEGATPAPTSPASPGATSTPTRVRPGKSLFKIALEVLLIALGVFLGLAGEQWRERVAHRDLAMASLRRFRAEIKDNRDSVARVMDYHVATRRQVEAYLDQDSQKRDKASLHIEGVQPASFERAAWDLALATQSLAYINPDLVFALSRIYTQQETYSALTSGLTQAMYLQPPRGNLDTFLPALAVYYDDLVLIEPALLKLYDAILPQLDEAIGAR